MTNVTGRMDLCSLLANTESLTQCNKIICRINCFSVCYWFFSAMRSGTLPKTKNVMSALSKLWTAMPSSKKIEYNAVARRENEMTPEKLYQVVESISPLKSPIYAEKNSDLKSDGDIDSEQIVPQIQGSSKQHPHSTKDKIPFEQGKSVSSANLELSEEIVDRISNILENSVDGADFLEMLDTTPKKDNIVPDDNQSKSKAKGSLKRKQARKCLNFDELHVKKSKYITLPRDDCIETYNPPEDHIIPDSYDYDEVENWNRDEICEARQKFFDISCEKLDVSVKFLFSYLIL